MYRYIVSLFLLYACCLSLPAPEYSLLAKSLTELANNCENQHISELIKSKVLECNITAPVNKKGYKEKLLECLMFYDMNTQLCSALSQSKLAIKDPDLKSTISEVQDVNNLCKEATSWDIGNLNDYPRYHGVAHNAFGDLVLCLKVCMSESDEIGDIIDSKFFCKYYQWGTKMLRSQVTLSASAPSKSEIIPLLSSTSLNNTSAISNQDLEVKVPASSTENKPQNAIQEEPAKLNEPKKSVVENNPQSELVTDKKNDLGAQSKTIIVTTNNVEKLSMDGEEPPKKEDVEKEQAQETEDKKNVVIENPKTKQSPDTDDYQGGDLDSEEGKEGLADTQGGDDGDDPMLPEVNVKPNQDQGKQSVKKIETSVSIFNGDTPKEFLPNPIPDGFVDDDDHFFPFFLTAVILVILIYVLYHNKSKVSKLFLGLIVEGRQPGRRRNSRGHAYRRLDTLEQAMSANTAAPPSKIIY